MGSNPQTALRNALTCLSAGPRLRADVTNAMKNFNPGIRSAVWGFLRDFKLVEIINPEPKKGKGGRGLLVVITPFGAAIHAGIEKQNAGG